MNTSTAATTSSAKRGRSLSGSPSAAITSTAPRASSRAAGSRRSMARRLVNACRDRIDSPRCCRTGDLDYALRLSAETFMPPVLSLYEDTLSNGAALALPAHARMIFVVHGIGDDRRTRSPTARPGTAKARSR